MIKAVQVLFHLSFKHTFIHTYAQLKILHLILFCQLESGIYYEIRTKSLRLAEKTQNIFL